MYSYFENDVLVLTDVDNAVCKDFVIELVGSACAVEVQVHFFQVAFVDDPCHGYLDAFARFEGRDIVSAITIVLVYTAVFHFMFYS